MKHKGKRMLAWLLAATVTFSGNSFTVLAEEMDFTNQPEISAEDEIQTETEEPVAEEVEVQDDFQSEETEEPVVEEETENEEEVSSEAAEAVIEDSEGELEEEPLFSAGDERESLNPEEYKIWFENLRDQEYSTYFFDNENGELRLNTENLNGKDASITWKVGYRRDDQEGTREDEFTPDMGLSDDMIFWEEIPENNNVLQISGEKLWKAHQWLEEEKGDEYWFEVRAYVNVPGEEEPVYFEQAGINAREHIEEHYLPEDEVILQDWSHWVSRNYNCYVQNADHPDGINLSQKITQISVVNAAEEEDNSPVCEINYQDEGGWNIKARRFGTAVVTLAYENLSGEEQKHSFRLYVDGHRFTLEPQWPASGENMLKNSEMTVSFVLYHEWKNSDEDQGFEEMKGWTLELDPNEDGYAYDTNLLDVEVHGKEHTITIRSKDNTWGTGITLRALHPSDDESEEPTYSYVNIPIEVCEEYDVLYPESIENINAGEVLDFNNCGLRVEHSKANEDPYTRNDVSYDFEYDKNQWTNEASEGQLPVLRRKTSDGTQITVIAKDGEDQEISRRDYWFDGLDYSVWFENLREGGYSTYFFNNENGELKLNTENLEGKKASVLWEIGYRRDDQEGSREDEFTSDMGLSDEMIFWKEIPENNNTLQISGEKLWKAHQWLEEAKGDEYWFEARAYVNVPGEEEPVYLAQAGINVRECREDYDLPEDEVLLVDQDYWISSKYNVYVENGENPYGREFEFCVTDVTVSSEEGESDTPSCEINHKDEDGWNICAARFGTTVVTLTYEDISGIERLYSFNLYVNSDKFTLEPQWPASGGNMLRNSEMKIAFVLNHEWRRNDEDKGFEEVQNWSLEFAPDDNGWKYDTNLLKAVEINGHEITIQSGEEDWGTDILLKAMVSSENGEQEDVAHNNVHIEVCEEYDVIYPENIENINVGESLDFNNCGLRVEHIKENEDPYTRNDVSYDFEYDRNQWTNEASEGQLPVLIRKTSDGTQITVIAKDGENQEISRRDYWFDGVDYSVWFENLRENDYSTYFFNNENGELELNTENLEGKKASVSWEIGYRRDDQDGSREDEFTSDMGLSDDMIFWKEIPENNNTLQISGEKLWKAHQWLEEAKGDEYWFEARAYVNVPGEEEPVYLAQAGINVRECREDYDLPEDEVLLVDQDYWISSKYNVYVENGENPYGREFEFCVTDVTVSSEEGESDTPSCEINHKDEDGWNICAARFGTTVVTLTYEDISGIERLYSFNLYVNSDKFTLEPQWPASGGNMLRNSEMKIAFVLNHEWRRNDEDKGFEEVQNWSLEFAPDDNGWKYDTNLLKAVEINGHEITIQSGEEDWGTDILLRAVVSSENGEQEDVAYNNVHIEVFEEYDVIYPENIENINAGEVLDFNNCGLRVEHSKANEDPYTRNDVSYDFEYDKNQWTNEASEGQLPVLRRKTSDDTQITVIVKDGENQEISRREYWFDGLDYSVWFENLREDDYWTYVFEGEKYAMHINAENLDDKNAEIQWRAGYRTDEGAEGGVQFTTDIPQEFVFWSLDKKDNSKIIIDANKLKSAYDWLYKDGNPGSDYWFEIQASVLDNGEVVSQTAAGLYTVREMVEDYELHLGRTLETVPGENLWLDQTFDCYVENPEYPCGADISVDISRVSTLDKDICSIAWLGNGWRMTPKKIGETRVEITYTDIHGKQQKGFFDISVSDAFYWCRYMPKDNVDSILSNSEKQYEISAYYEDAQNPGKDIKVDDSKYELVVEEDSYDKDAIESVKIEGTTLTIKIKDIEDREVSVGVRAFSKEKDADGNPLWSTETVVYAYAVKEYPTQIRLENSIEVNPKTGETFDLNNYGPHLIRYDSDTKTWEKMEDADNIRICLEYDKNSWKAVSEGDIPELQRINPVQTNIRVIAQERRINRYGAEVWETIAEDGYFFSTVYDQTAECSHIWETVTDSKPTCGKAGKQHQECTACQERKELPDIPATGKHTWKTVTDQKPTCGKAGKQHQECTVCQERKGLSDIPATGRHKWGKYTVTRKATVFAQGQETRTCSICKKKETRKTAKLKAALNLSVYSFPLQKGKTATVKVSGLKNGDYVKTVSSKKSSVLKAVKLKNGSIKLTAQKNLKKKTTVKVLVKTAGGASRTISVTVQSGQVKTTKITGVSKNLKIKRGKTSTLKPVRNPFTSQEKITYTSSNKKIATVDAKGRVKGIKPGKAVITVRSGSAVFKCTVNVVK